MSQMRLAARPAGGASALPQTLLPQSGEGFTSKGKGGQGRGEDCLLFSFWLRAWSFQSFQIHSLLLPMTNLKDDQLLFQMAPTE